MIVGWCAVLGEWWKSVLRNHAVFFSIYVTLLLECVHLLRLFSSFDSDGWYRSVEHQMPRHQSTGWQLSQFQQSWPGQSGWPQCLPGPGQWCSLEVRTLLCSSWFFSCVNGCCYFQRLYWGSIWIKCCIVCEWNKHFWVHFWLRFSWVTIVICNFYCAGVNALAAPAYAGFM